MKRTIFISTLVIVLITVSSVVFGIAASLSLSGGTIQVFNIEPGISIQPGTSLAAEKTAQGFWEQGDTGERFGVRGQVCVTNPGDFPTQNLAILDTIQVKLHLISQYADYQTFPIDVSAKPVLAPGETYCYPYEYPFIPFDEAKYRNTARVTITNHSGWLPGSHNCPGPQPCPFGPNPKAPFSLPDSPAVIRVPENPAPPRLGVLTPIVKGPVEPTAQATAEATAGATAEATAILQPEASPTPTATPSAASPASPTPPESQRATPTPAPTLKPESACVYSLDYWRDHPQEWPLDEILLGVDPYSRKQALELLSIDPGEDATLLLARQLISARLNLANGAEGDTIAIFLVESDEWLEDNPLFSNPKEQARQKGKSFAAELQDFNRGESGPEACPPGQVTPTSAPTLELVGTPSVPPTLVPILTWTPTSTLEPPTVIPSLPPTDTPQPPSPTPPPTDTQVPDSPTPTPSPTQELQPTETEPPLAPTEEPTPLPW
jgi:hypothetical protein